MTQGSADKRPIFIILAVFVAISFAYSVVNPLHEASDELRHYRFVRHIVQRGSLPVQGQGACSAQGHHPPLFYALGAAATFWIDTSRNICHEPPRNPFWNYRYWEVGVDNKNQYLHYADETFPWHGEALAAHIVRGLNVLIGAGVVYLTWLIGRAIWPKRPYLALGGVALVAFNPMFAYVAGAVNNDVTAAFSGAAVMLACVRLLRDEEGLSWRWGLALGALYGMALMSKFNLAALAIVVETAVTYVAWQKQQWRRWWQTNFLIAGLTLLIAGWWFARNQALYGELTGFRTMTELWGGRDPSTSFWLAVSEIPYAWTTLWGRFGYGQVPLPAPVYAGLRWLTRFALLGLFLPFLRRRLGEIRAGGIPLALQGVNVLLFATVLFNYMMLSTAGAMGRFFFPALPSLGLLVFYGLSQWLGLIYRRDAKDAEKRTRRRGKWLAGAANGGMVVLALVVLLGYLQPAYARPPSFGPETAVPNPINAQFGGFVRLKGYEVTPKTLYPGAPIDVNLYWEVVGQPPGNYLLFVHLIDQEGTMVAQRDTHPGLGNFPSSQWQPGDRFVESIRLYVPETAYAPTQATLGAGFYVPGENGYRLAITTPDGSRLGDALPLTEVAIESARSSAAVPNPQNWNLGNSLHLVGYEYNTRLLEPDDVLSVTLYWQPTTTATDDYVAQIWVLNEESRIVALRERKVKTNATAKSDIFTTRLDIKLPDEMPEPTYGVQLRLLDAMTKEPQNLVAEDGHLINNYLNLARIRVNREASYRTLFGER